MGSSGICPTQLVWLPHQKLLIADVPASAYWGQREPFRVDTLIGLQSRECVLDREREREKKEKSAVSRRVFKHMPREML